jgi:hypothetical protein
MGKPQLNKTYTAFTNDPKFNRAGEVRRDNDLIKTPKCTIYDVDYAIISYIRDIIQPQVIEHDATVDVPIIYSSGEKWAMVRARGYMIDTNGKLMTPIISLKRNSITERDTLKKLDVNWNPAGDNAFARNTEVFQNKFSRVNQYDRFSILQGAKPVKEIYVSAIPEYIDVSYDLMIWTQLNEQMNSIVEQIMPVTGYAWGTTWKFPTMISDYTFETLNTVGEERVVRTTIPLTVKATLMIPYEVRRSQVQKQFSVKRVVFSGETDSFNVNITDTPPNGY